MSLQEREAYTGHCVQKHFIAIASRNKQIKHSHSQTYIYIYIYIYKDTHLHIYVCVCVYIDIDIQRESGLRWFVYLMAYQTSWVILYQNYPHREL